MLERAKQVTRQGKYTSIEYARCADDVGIVIDAHPQHDWLLGAVDARLRQELARFQIAINEVKSRVVDLGQGERVDFVGCNCRRVRSRRGVWQPVYTPPQKKRTAVLQRVKEVCRRHRSQAIRKVIETMNPILHGWINYVAIGASSRCVGSVRDGVEKKVRRHLRRARKRPGFGWRMWSRRWLYSGLGLVGTYRVRRRQPRLKVLPVWEVP
jgi:RNA-directed DNA polymerase